MIFDGTTRVAGSSVNLSPNVSHALSSASDICRINSGSNAWPAKNGVIGTGFNIAGIPELERYSLAMIKPLFREVKDRCTRITPDGGAQGSITLYVKDAHTGRHDGSVSGSETHRRATKKLLSGFYDRGIAAAIAHTC